MLKVLCVVFGIVLSLSATQGGHKNHHPKVTIPLWTLLLKAEDVETLPLRFRTTMTKIPGTLEASGLSSLNMSGSAQFSELQFKSLVHYVEKFGITPGQIIIFDLREEPHGFINGNAVTWYAKGAWWTQGDPVVLVVADEKKRLNALSVGQDVLLKRIAYKDAAGYVQKLDDYPLKVTALKTEEQVVNEMGAHYIRIAVTDHTRPDDKDVDQFLDILKNLPAGVWLHFHCAAGRGRTSTFMVMYDIIHNPNLSLDAILDRQVWLGSLDLRHLSVHLKVRKQAQQKFRLQFIKDFYNYRHAPDGYGVKSWTKWAMDHYVKPDHADEKSNDIPSSKVASASWVQSQ